MYMFCCDYKYLIFITQVRFSAENLMRTLENSQSKILLRNSNNSQVENSRECSKNISQEETYKTLGIENSRECSKNISQEETYKTLGKENSREYSTSNLLRVS